VSLNKKCDYFVFDKYIICLFEVTVPIEEINKRAKIYSSFQTVQKVADHYNVYKDLFGQAFFTPSVDLKVEYAAEKESKSLVYYGNKIPPRIVKILHLHNFNLFFLFHDY
jgi:hypothetical protein